MSIAFTVKVAFSFFEAPEFEGLPYQVLGDENFDFNCSGVAWSSYRSIKWVAGLNSQWSFSSWFLAPSFCRLPVKSGIFGGKH
jgi:hypothetical protein